MKILCPSYITRHGSYGGIESYTRDLHEALLSDGIQTTIFEVPVIPVSCETENEYLSNGSSDIQTILEDALSQESYDVIHSHNLHFAPNPLLSVISTVANRHKIPIVNTVHDLSRDHFGSRRLSGLGVFFRRTQSVVTSAYNERLFRELIGINPAACIYPGIDFERFRTNASPEEKTIAYPGRLTLLKGALEAARIIGNLSDKIGEIHFLLSDPSRNAAGESPRFFQRLKEATSEFRNLKVEFVTGIYAIPEIYQRSVLTLTLPLITEGFGLVPLESLASSRPVIAVPTGGMEWLNGIPGAITFKQRDDQLLLEAIETVLSNWNEWHLSAQSAIALLKRLYDVSVSASQYRNLYLRVRHLLQS